MVPSGRNLIGALALTLAAWQPYPGVARAAPAPGGPPATKLVARLNENARRVRNLLCTNVAIDVKQGRQAVGMDGRLAFRRPGRLRLVAKLLGESVLDGGANEREFWWGFGKGGAFRLYSSPRGPAARGKAPWPLPFHPDWVAEVLGLAEHDPARGYKVVVRPGGMELVRKVAGPHGRRVRKVTVFERARGGPRVTGYRLEDADGRVLWRVSLVRVERDPASGATLPRGLLLESPAQDLRVSVRLGEVTVNDPLFASRGDRLFRPLTTEE